MIFDPFVELVTSWLRKSDIMQVVDLLGIPGQIGTAVLGLDGSITNSTGELSGDDGNAICKQL